MPHHPNSNCSPLFDESWTHLQERDLIGQKGPSSQSGGGEMRCTSIPRQHSQGNGNTIKSRRCLLGTSLFMDESDLEWRKGMLGQNWKICSCAGFGESMFFWWHLKNYKFFSQHFVGWTRWNTSQNNMILRKRWSFNVFHQYELLGYST